ncbi:MAG: ribosome biogenesis GTPase Der [bacterium JZ-2024 1]
MQFVIAIVGRPNVGKSTLFNALVGKRKAIVEKTPGVTRDRIYGIWEIRGRKIRLIDSAGVPPAEPSIPQIIQQTEKAVEEAHLILFLTDIKDGLTPADKEISQWLRQKNKNTILLVNKVDSPKQWMDAMDFSELGWDFLLPISALHKKGLDTLEDMVAGFLPEEKETEEETSPLLISLVGKRNVGKSTLLNYLAHEERAVVSPQPGTTRDILEAEILFKNHPIRFMDMAGLHLKKRRKADIDFYSEVRALEAIETSDAAIFLLDAETGITLDDKKIAGFLEKVKKPFVYAVNKWDLVTEKKKQMQKQFIQHLYDSLPRFTFIPVLFISAKTGWHIPDLLKQILQVIENGKVRVPTPILNRILSDFRETTTLPSRRKKRLYLAYATQVGISPPHFVLMVNDPDLVNNSVLLQWEQFLRRFYPFPGVCLRFTVRKKS